MFFTEMREFGVVAVTFLGKSCRSASAVRAGLKVAQAPLGAGGRITEAARQLLREDHWQVIWCEEDGLPDAVVDLAPGGSVFIIPKNISVSKAVNLRPLNQVAPPPGFQLLVKRRRVDVVIPVYNAPNETRACIEALKKNDEQIPMLDVRYIVIDDASTDPSISPLLAEVVPENWVCFRNENNLGFVKTVNKAFRLDDVADVMLLNSDTRVPPGWLSRLGRTSGMARDIATVTSVSNEASIYSWPANPDAVKNLNFAAVHSAFSAEGARLVPLEIPMGVGFCCYIRRTAIIAANGFDEIFGIGYGEETDFCLKTRRLGFRHLLEPRVYVRHSGGASMASVFGSERKNNTHPQNEAIIRARYPDLQYEVGRYNTFKRSHLTHQLSTAFVEHQSAVKRHILIVTHKPLFSGSIGGVEFHSEETIHHLKDRFVFSSLAPWQDVWTATVDCACVGIPIETFMLGTTEGAQMFLEMVGPDVIHVQHPMGVPEGLVEAAGALGIPIVVSVHDYALVCPRYNLVGRNGLFCELPSIEDVEHRSCLDEGGLTAIDLRDWRRRSQRLLDAAALTIFVSDHVKKRVQSIFNVGASAVISCGISPGSTKSQGVIAPKKRRSKSSLDVCFIGAGRQDKGTELVSALTPQLSKAGFKVHFLGSMRRQWPKLACYWRNVKFHGTYGSSEVVDKLQQIAPDVVCLVSPWPETFSRTLSEAWHAGIPALVSPFGAPAERVKETGAGWVLPRYTAQACFDLLRHIAEDPAELERVRRRVLDTDPPKSDSISELLAIHYESFPNRGKCAQLRGTARMSVAISGSLLLSGMQPRSFLGRMARFAGMIGFRLEEAGLWRTLQRPALKVLSSLTNRFI